jgi:hypothetical protein
LERRGVPKIEVTTNLLLRFSRLIAHIDIEQYGPKVARVTVQVIETALGCDISPHAYLPIPFFC